jgi:alpha-glucosidase
MRNLDAMGYNAASTDPLYKHIPFTIAQRSDVSYGLFYDNLSSCWLDLGNEIDNYHTAYRRWQAEAGDIDYYLFPANGYWISPKFVRLTGKTLFDRNGVSATAVRRCTTPTRRMRKTS